MRLRICTVSKKNRNDHGKKTLYPHLVCHGVPAVMQSALPTSFPLETMKQKCKLHNLLAACSRTDAAVLAGVVAYTPAPMAPQLLVLAMLTPAPLCLSTGIGTTLR